ncbi:ribosome silencing factor [Scrofimicrobium sp. R131]|uniref:Ribosomal silencing factor RsfS n=1 Tax=Scrofimicrobium appendicitidis TaxID=3079930 RepID=A0AAU7V6N5_9ACTO
MTCTNHALELLEIAAKAADDALGLDPLALDVSEQLYLADIFFLVTADNPRHSRSIAEEITTEIKKATGQLPVATEGELGSGWVVVDYGDLVVHVLQPEERDFYALDKLWDKSPRLVTA